MTRDDYLPISYFDAIYLIDLCEPLLDVARQRFAARGWKNVHVLCQDASKFVLPEWESGELDPRGSLTAITLSYSLSMVSLEQCSAHGRFHLSTNYWTGATRC
jgi:betaine lipid synthase